MFCSLLMIPIIYILLSLASPSIINTYQHLKFHEHEKSFITSGSDTARASTRQKNLNQTKINDRTKLSFAFFTYCMFSQS